MNEFYLIEKIISGLKKETILYQDLFGSKDSVTALKNSYPEAFAIFQQAMFFEIICRISALFDPTSTRSDKNLTLDHLLELCGDKVGKDLLLEVESVKYDFKKTGIKDVRNKSYAHNDLKKYLGKKLITTNISYEVITKLLDDLFSVVRSLGIKSGMVKSNQIIVRDKKLPRHRNGLSLVSKLSGA
jgi:hypothetical protein